MSAECGKTEGFKGDTTTGLDLQRGRDQLVQSRCAKEDFKGDKMTDLDL